MNFKKFCLVKLVNTQKNYSINVTNRVEIFLNNIQALENEESLIFRRAQLSLPIHKWPEATGLSRRTRSEFQRRTGLQKDFIIPNTCK